MIIREIKKNPFVASQNVANTLDLNIAARTVGDRALKAKLRSRIVEKKTLQKYFGNCHVAVCKR